MNSKKYFCSIKEPNTRTRKPRKPCSRCVLLNKNATTPRLCNVCENYANQDYVSLRETPLPPEVINQKLDELIFDFDDGESNSQGSSISFEKIISLARLSPMQKKVLRLKYQEGLSRFEISRRLKLSENSIANHLRRAFRKFTCDPFLLLVGGNVNVGKCQTWRRRHWTQSRRHRYPLKSLSRTAMASFNLSKSYSQP